MVISCILARKHRTKLDIVCVLLFLWLLAGFVKSITIDSPTSTHFEATAQINLQSSQQ